MSSFLTGEAWVREGRQTPGRRLAKRPKCLRSGSRAPRSGWMSGGRLSHLGPPTEPKRMASLFSQAEMVSAGSGVSLLVASSAAPPTSWTLRSVVKPNFASTASRTRRASVMTSGPMPSPARTAMRWVRDMREGETLNPRLETSKLGKAQQLEMSWGFPVGKRGNQGRLGRWRCWCTSDG